MTELRIDSGDIKVSQVYPKELPDLFAGSDLSVMGRFSGSGPAAITLRGRERDRKRKFVYECTFPEKERNNNFIEKLWATRKIGYLLDAITEIGGRSQEAGELIDEVIVLSKKYGIVTPYTSYLVQEDGIRPTPAPMLPRRRPGRPIYLNQSDTMRLESGKKADAMNQPAPANSQFHAGTQVIHQTGESGVKRSKEVARFKDSITLEREPEETRFKYTPGRRFRQENGVWVQEGVQEEDAATITIKYMSEAYFELLRLRPEITDILGLGEKVKFQLKAGVIIEIAPEGPESLSEDDIKKIRK
jgi:Ca-activated chloride channel family protein